MKNTGPILKKRVKDQEGVLSDNRYTEYSRAVMALKSIGKDPTDIGGYDIEKVAGRF